MYVSPTIPMSRKRKECKVVNKITVIQKMHPQITPLCPNSLERSPVVGDFYGTGVEIWAEWPT